MVPDDYMSISDIPSIHNHAISHVMPVISHKLINELGNEFPARPGRRDIRADTGTEN